MFTPGTPRPPGPGRKRGTKNRVTLEVRELARGLVGSPEYLERLRQRLIDGTAGTVEQALLGSGLTGSFNMWSALRNPNSQTLSTTTPATQGFSWSGLGAATQGGLGPGVGSGVNAGNFLNLTQQNQPYPTYTSGFLTNPPPGFLGLK